METNKKELTIPSELRAIRQVTDFVNDRLTENGCPEEMRRRIELAVEEMLVNVVNYAYPDGPGRISVAIRFPEKGLVRLEISDDGIPYDPTKKPDPDMSIPLKKRGRGGLGIFLSRTVMDSMTYDHADGCNHVVMTKKYIYTREQNYLPIVNR